MKRIVILLSVGCVVLLGNFYLARECRAESEDEAAIKLVLSQYENAWNKRDAANVLALYHDKAKIMHGREKRMVSKEEYAKVINDSMKQHSYLSISFPKITVNGENTTVTAWFSGSGRSMIMKMFLERINGKWLIVELSY